MRDVLIESIVNVQCAYSDLEQRVLLALSDTQITPAAAIVVVCLGSQSLSPTEIMRRRYYIASNLSYTLKMLEKAGLIQAGAPSIDRRGRKIRLTEAGDELASRIRAQLTVQVMEHAA